MLNRGGGMRLFTPLWNSHFTPLKSEKLLDYPRQAFETLILPLSKKLERPYVIYLFWKKYANNYFDIFYEDTFF